MSKDKKIIYFLVALIILLSVVLIVKIKTTPKYDPKVYDEIYAEYEAIFGKEEDIQADEESIIEHLTETNSIAQNNNYQTTVIRPIQNNSEQSNVIGKIIIPEIDIKYPIIKTTNEEYLKVAPTKYCGPEVNEVRKFSHSRT